MEYYWAVKRKKKKNTMVGLGARWISKVYVELKKPDPKSTHWMVSCTQKFKKGCESQHEWTLSQKEKKSMEWAHWLVIHLKIESMN